MDIVPLAGMLFALLVVLIIAGTILMLPVMRRLGRLLETKSEEQRRAALPAKELAGLQEAIEGLEAEVSRLAERQAFTDRLLEDTAGDERP